MWIAFLYKDIFRVIYTDTCIYWKRDKYEMYFLVYD